MNASSLSNIGNVRLKGPLGKRLDTMIANHVCATDVDYITAPFFEKTETKQWWQTEFWGKWMHSATPYLAYCGSEKLKAAVWRGIDRILSSQEQCGYIGNYPDELRFGDGWDVWGMKYTMMGLLHHYDYAKDVAKDDASAARSLEACERLCDYVIGEIGPGGRRGVALWQTGNWCGYASSSILEPVMWLYKRTGEGRYLDFASYIVEGMEKPESGPRLIDLALKGVSVADRNGYGNTPETDGGYVSKHNRWKAYEMMSCYQGLLEYWEVAGRKELLEAAVKAAEDIVREEVNLAGGCSSCEGWFHGARKQHLPYMHLQETCVTTTWMRLCEKLLSVTGDARWADEVERTFYNAYLGAMKADGAEFAGYTPLSGYRTHGQHHCFMHTDCCTANGPRGFLCFLKEQFRAEHGAATFNFYASALVRGTLEDGREVAFDMYALYPAEDWARIVSHTQCAGVVPLRLRIPAWSAKTRVTLNGEELEGVKAGAYFTIEREWKLGDIVEVHFDMQPVGHVLDHNVAITRGPVLLARDSRFGDGDLSEPFRHWAVANGCYFDTFSRIRPPSDDIWMAFAATCPVGLHHANPEGRQYDTVFFCDYASAGNTWRKADYYRTWFPVERFLTD